MITLATRLHQAGTQYDIDPVTGCWITRFRIETDGYARVRWLADKREASMMVHRASWLHHRGPIESGDVLDHRCRNRACVNPDHLEPVPVVVNAHRALNVKFGDYEPSKECPQGHSRAEFGHVSAKGRITCRPCNAAAVARYKLRKEGATA